VNQRAVLTVKKGEDVDPGVERVCEPEGGTHREER
jgi:hypothetical protein